MNIGFHVICNGGLSVGRNQKKRDEQNINEFLRSSEHLLMHPRIPMGVNSED